MYFRTIAEAQERYKFKLVEAEVDPAMEAFKKPRVRISVEGYDTSLPQEDINKALVDLFSSCGEIINVAIPIDPETHLVERRAFMILRGDGAEENALQLDGRDVGGWNVVVKVTPEENEETDNYRHTLLENLKNDEQYKFGVAVYGYDMTSLPDDDVKSTFERHFSSCGDITCVLLGREDRKALIYFTQEEAEGKALKLNGSAMEGFQVTVHLAATVRRSRSSSTASVRMFDYCVPAHCIMLAKENNKKIMAFKKERGLV
ncbi:unnamed protein product [Microthlaspi erraticum]|jgi:hypothetical protein|uniref:RRM domain-containing protein n=1 Tax=Microthlaspi erraticum TaxID=1685480 RepID=A0A6D2KEW8_9BRAS|nr:unnamed protein product [Microthlaspi erraticum]